MVKRTLHNATFYMHCLSFIYSTLTSLKCTLSLLRLPRPWSLLNQIFEWDLLSTRSFTIGTIRQGCQTWPFQYEPCRLFVLFCFLCLWKKLKELQWASLLTWIWDACLPAERNVGRSVCLSVCLSVCVLNHGLAWAKGLINLSGWRSPSCSVPWKMRLSPEEAKTFWQTLTGISNSQLRVDWSFVLWHMWYENFSLVEWFTTYFPVHLNLFWNETVSCFGFIVNVLLFIGMCFVKWKHNGQVIPIIKPKRCTNFSNLFLE